MIREKGWRGTSDLPDERKGLAGRQKEGWVASLEIEGRQVREGEDEDKR